MTSLICGKASPVRSACFVPHFTRNAMLEPLAAEVSGLSPSGSCGGSSWSSSDHGHEIVPDSLKELRVRTDRRGKVPNGVERIAHLTVPPWALGDVSSVSSPLA